MHEVDHDQRRQKIAEIAVDVISNDGMDAATVRNIAAKAGYSTTIITHYFNDKDELLLLAFRHITKLTSERLKSITDRDPGDILGILMGMTALEENTTQGWRVYIAFWQKAGHNPDFAREQQQGIELALNSVANSMTVRYGNRPDIQTISRHLVALVHGISIQYLFNPGCWSPKEIEQTLGREIEFLVNKQ